MSAIAHSLPCSNAPMKPNPPQLIGAPKKRTKAHSVASTMMPALRKEAAEAVRQGRSAVQVAKEFDAVVALILELWLRRELARIWAHFEVIEQKLGKAA